MGKKLLWLWYIKNKMEYFHSTPFFDYVYILFNNSSIKLLSDSIIENIFFPKSLIEAPI